MAAFFWSIWHILWYTGRLRVSTIVSSAVPVRHYFPGPQTLGAITPQVGGPVYGQVHGSEVGPWMGPYISKTLYLTWSLPVSSELIYGRKYEPELNSRL